MNTQPLRLTLATLALGLLVACGNQNTPPASTTDPASTGPQTALGRTVDRAMSKAREELATTNLDLNNTVQVRSGGVFIGSERGPDDRPKGEITPAGDLLIDGTPVAINESQRRLLLDYRTSVLAIAETGMALGVRGADLGMKAAGEALRGVFSGNTDQIEKNIKAEAEKLKLESRLICTQLQSVHEGQQALRASVPEFEPYANLSEESARKCVEKSEESDGMAVFDVNPSSTQAQVQTEIRDGIRQGIRSAVQGVSAATGTGSTASLDGVRFLLPVGSVAVDSSNGVGTIDAGGDVLVRMDAQVMSINGARYARPARDAVVNLREPGKVLVNGEAVSALR